MMPSKSLICSPSCRPLRAHEEHLQQPEGDHEPGRHGPGRHPQLLPSLPAVYSAVHAGAGDGTARLPHPQRRQWPRRHREDTAAQLRWWILEPECRIHRRIRLLLSDGLASSCAVLISVPMVKEATFCFLFLRLIIQGVDLIMKRHCAQSSSWHWKLRWIGGKYTSKWKWLWLFLESLWVTHTLWIIFDFQTHFFRAWTEASFSQFNSSIFLCILVPFLVWFAFLCNFFLSGLFLPKTHRS